MTSNLAEAPTAIVGGTASAGAGWAEAPIGASSEPTWAEAPLAACPGSTTGAPIVACGEPSWAEAPPTSTGAPIGACGEPSWAEAPAVFRCASFCCNLASKAAFLSKSITQI
ncbi:MAG: hypothetical protein GY772_13090 [bacterium]|nr:hypothetical protein [bacterium]